MTYTPTDAEIEALIDALEDFGIEVAPSEATAAIIAAHKAREASAARQTEAPEGWRLVPVEPTEKMADAAQDVPSGIGGSPPHWKNIWRAMLAAAPTAEGEK